MRSRVSARTWRDALDQIPDLKAAWAVWNAFSMSVSEAEWTLVVSQHLSGVVYWGGSKYCAKISAVAGFSTGILLYLSIESDKLLVSQTSLLRHQRPDHRPRVGTKSWT
jgi:hypothetical protein